MRPTEVGHRQEQLERTLSLIDDRRLDFQVGPLPLAAVLRREKAANVARSCEARVYVPLIQ